MRCISDVFVQKKKTTTSCLPNVELRTFQKMHFADNLSCLSEWMKKKRERDSTVSSGHTKTVSQI